MLEKDLTTRQADELFKVILGLRTLDECRNFFRDICTLGELKAMIERFQVAKMIRENVPYREISKKTGASTATVTRIAYWLHHGMGGYELVLDRLKR